MDSSTDAGSESEGRCSLAGNIRPLRRTHRSAGLSPGVWTYDRDGIVYRNERLARDFKLASRVDFETPAAGVLENVQGLCAKVLLLG